MTAEDDEDEGPRPLLSAGFWAALAFGVVCIAAAGGVFLAAVVSQGAGPGRHAPGPPSASNGVDETGATR